MAAVPYDATRNALFHPGTADNFFQLGPLNDDAALCAEMARLAYVKEEARLTTYLDRAKFDLQHTFGYGNQGTQVFIAGRRNSALTVVAFRGSEPEDPSDLFADAEFAMTAWHDAAGRELGQVHGGFARYAHDDDAFRLVKTHLDGLPQHQRVLITGHSLGAALATLLASWLPSTHLCSFGSPRVGNAAFAASLHNPVSTRFVNCCDIVTRIPPETGLGYAHIGTLAYLDRKGTRLNAPTEATMQDDQVQAGIEYLPHALARGTVFSRDLADHAPINYVSGVMGVRA